jgi:L-asparaginase
MIPDLTSIRETAAQERLSREKDVRAKIILFSTGGTIAMRYSPESGGATPALSGSELIASLPACRFPVEVREFSNIPSPHMTPKLMLDLARQVEQVLSAKTTAGVVVTHGTDTLEETAYFLDLYVRADKALCLTGAMRDADELCPDGPKNLLCALKVAASPEAAKKGCLVVMNEEIHAAREVTKVHSSSLKTFASPFWGPLGHADVDRLIFRRAPLGRQTLHPENIEEDVHLIKCAAGCDDFLLHSLTEKKAKGIVVEGMGRGNVPPLVFNGIKEALAAGIPVVLASRCLSGRTLDHYAYAGGAKKLHDAGVILGGEISGPKARIKLMLALGLTRDPDRLAEYFDKP